MKTRTWVVIIAISLGAVVLLQNMEVVSFKIFFWELTMSRIIAFPLLILLGIIVGFFLGKYARIGAQVGKR